MNQTAYLDSTTASLKEVHWFRSRELQMNTQIVRWGNFGTPLLLFPTAGGDAEEVERFFLIKLLAPFIHEGRLKVYSVDSINGKTWITDPSIPHRVWIQQQYDKFITNEIVPLIRRDCNHDQIEIMTGGASIGAFNALVCICRHPEIFNRAICLSGTYDIQKWLEGQWYDEFYHQSPLHFVPGLPEGDHLNRLRQRFILLASGQGAHEAPDESWKVAEILGSKYISNRVDLWDHTWKHDWTTWREMLPKYVQEMLVSV
jgi:esterase/lipase superfamily enzyme